METAALRSALPPVGSVSLDCTSVESIIVVKEKNTKQIPPVGSKGKYLIENVVTALHLCWDVR